MASWTDGAAYAPIERPDGFATPEVEPLEHVDKSVAATAGPVPPPQQFQQNTPVIPLAQVRTAPLPRRNPSEPFLVSGGLMTTASSMGHHALRDPHTPFHTRDEMGSAQNVGLLPPPTGQPLVFGMDAPSGPPQSGLDALMSSGTARPGPSGQRSASEMSTQRTLVFLATACCLLGFTIGEAAPYMLIAGGSLALRARFLTGRAGLWAIGVGLVLIMAGFIVPPGFEVLLGRLASMSFGIWFISSVMGGSKGRR